MSKIEVESAISPTFRVWQEGDVESRFMRKTVNGTKRIFTGTAVECINEIRNRRVVTNHTFSMFPTNKTKTVWKVKYSDTDPVEFPDRESALEYAEQMLIVEKYTSKIIK